MSMSTRVPCSPSSAPVIAASRLDPVHLRHADVHEHDVGPSSRASSTASSPSNGLADDLEVVLGVEDHPEAGADERLVVGDAGCGASRSGVMPPATLPDAAGSARGRRSRRPAAAARSARRRRPRRARASRRCPWPLAGQRRRLPAPLPRSEMTTSSAVGVPARAAPRSGAAPGVLDRVRQRLLDDPVDGGLGAGGQLAGLALDARAETGSPACAARSTSASSSSSVGCGAMAGARRRSSRARRAAGASRRARARRSARSAVAASVARVGVAVEDAPRAAGLHDHHRDRVARRRRASRGRSGGARRRPRGGLLLALLLGAERRLVQLGGEQGAVADRAAGRPRGGDERAREDEVADDAGRSTAIATTQPPRITSPRPMSASRSPRREPEV